MTRMPARGGGGGGKVPLGKIIGTEDFAGTDVTVETSGARVKNSNLRISDDSAASLGTSSFADPIPDPLGFYFTPKIDMDQVEIYLPNDSPGIDTLGVADVNGSFLASTTPNAGAWNTFDVSLSAGTDYQARATGPGDDIDAERRSGNTASGTLVDITDGLYDGGRFSTAYGPNSVRYGKNPTSAEATVKIEAPDLIAGWDRATFQKIANDGAVDVYIETNNGGGWVEEAGPIQRGAEIPAGADETVRFRFDMSRPSGSATSPNVVSLYQRYIL
jgi:hypothetical protein